VLCVFAPYFRACRALSRAVELLPHPYCDKLRDATASAVSLNQLEDVSNALSLHVSALMVTNKLATLPLSDPDRKVRSPSVNRVVVAVKCL
jgi:hypothetical protein